jgi:capsular polysaccharide transport system permease protein
VALRSPTHAAADAAPKPRHRAIAISLLLSVVAPSLAVIGYLYGVAADQYASKVAFSVRSSETSAPVEFLGGITSALSGNTGTDAEIIYDYLRSQSMVEVALGALPLEEFWSAPSADIVFRLERGVPIEDVHSYWRWMTSANFDGGTGIVEFEARAFEPEAAQAIAALALTESTRLVNELSRRAREDAVSVAKETLDAAEERLRRARREIRAFRDLEQELDPTENARATLGLIGGLEQELAQTEIELDAQLTLVGEGSPRVQVLRQRIASLSKQITEERARLGAGAAAQDDVPQNRALSDLLAQYEELAVDQEFAENAYVSALSSFEQAQLEARRQMRYLTPHIEPTLSVEPQYPRRALIAATTPLVLCVAWAVLVLIWYNIRDRR